MSAHDHGTSKSTGVGHAGGSLGGAGHAAPGKQTLVGSLIQMMPAAGGAGAESSSGVHAAAERGISGSGGALPFGDTIQRAFGGHDISGIQAHTDGAAAEGAGAMGAQAFATGNHVAFGSAPDLHTAAHEAAHIVQQRAGVHLKGGVGEAGDPYERNADEVADRVVQGQSAEDLLPAVGSSQPAAGAAQRKLQLRGNAAASAPAEITAAQIASALAWVTSSRIGPEAIREVQRVCGIDQTGTYGEETARAVFAKQRELQIGADGIAGNTFCRRTGIIFSQAATAATIDDAMLQQIATRFPDGVTIAIVPSFVAGVDGRAEFARQATAFAQTQGAVGLAGSAVVLGQACTIVEVGDVIEVVQSIHLGLVARWRAAQPGGTTGATAGAGATEAASSGAGATGGTTGGAAGVGATAGTAGASVPPAYTKVKNLALFSHGEEWGMGLNSTNDFSAGGLHNNTTRGVNPPNVESFVRGLTAAVVPDVRVQLFACSTGGDETRASGTEWTDHAQGDRAGGNSFGSSMAQAFGGQSTVSAHTTVGHTTENYAARVFGAEAGGGTDGITLFDSMYPESFVQSELVRLFPTQDDAGRAARHNSLREQMWAHFKDSITGEHHRARGEKRYSRPIGQEAFVNPENARTLIHADWTANWIPTRLTQVRAATPPR